MNIHTSRRAFLKGSAGSAALVSLAVFLSRLIVLPVVVRPVLFVSLLERPG